MCVVMAMTHWWRGRRGFRDPIQKSTGPRLPSGQLTMVFEVRDRAGKNDGGWASHACPYPCRNEGMRNWQSGRRRWRGWWRGRRPYLGMCCRRAEGIHRQKNRTNKGFHGSPLQIIKNYCGTLTCIDLLVCDIFVTVENKFSHQKTDQSCAAHAGLWSFTTAPVVPAGQYHFHPESGLAACRLLANPATTLQNVG